MDMNLLRQAMCDLEEDRLLELTREAAAQEHAEDALSALQAGMDDVGQRFEAGEYFVGDLIYSGELMTEAMEILRPVLFSGSGAGLGKMILCTVKDDLHDIGKNIVKAMLEAAGFEVLDLGINVEPSAVVEAVRANDIHIVALSGVLTLALASMRSTIEALEEAGLRSQVKVIIGGNPVNAEACKAIGADEYAHSPQKTVNVCRGWAAQ